MGDPIYRLRNSLLVVFSNIYTPNLLILCRHLEAINDGNIALNLHLDKNHHQLEVNYVTDLQRLLHNYLAARSSVIDFARKINNKYHIEKYIQEVDSFKLSLENRFLCDLRNFVLHFDIAPIVQRSSFHFEGGEASVKYRHTLSTERLLASGFKWNSEARSFLESRIEIDLLDVLKTNNCLVEHSIIVLFSEINFGNFKKRGSEKVETRGF